MAKRGRPPKHAENGDKRTEVLGVASKFFLSQGFDGASINAMARDSGISKESIYRYFESKEDLFAAVIEKELELYHQRLVDNTDLDRFASLDEALLETAEHMFTTIMSDRTLALRRLIFQEATRSPHVGELYYRIGPTPAYERLQEIFTHFGVAQGKRARSLARHFTGMLLHGFGLERECALREAPSGKVAKVHCSSIVEDFTHLFVCEEA